MLVKHDFHAKRSSNSSSPSKKWLYCEKNFKMAVYCDVTLTFAWTHGYTHCCFSA